MMRLLTCLAAAAAVVVALSAAPAVAEFPPRAGFNVGLDAWDGNRTSLHGRDVVRNGTLTYPNTWSLDHPHVVSTVVNYFDLYVSLEHLEHMNDTQVVGITWGPDGVFDMQVTLEGTILEVGHEVNLTTGVEQQIRLHVEVECTNRTAVGHGQVELALPLFEVPALVFSYNCTGAKDFAFDFFVSDSADEGKGVNVIEHGQPIHDFGYVVPVSRDTADFFVYLDGFQPAGTNLSYAIVPDWDEPMVEVTLDKFDGVAVSNARERFQVTFKCNEKFNEETITNTSVTFTFQFDNGKEDAFFDLIKTCHYVPAPHGDNDGGWSPFGIFCFTVFIITLVFCVGGCAINRFHFHKQGADIIPGMPLYRRCVGSDQGVYSPQADLDTALASTGGAYGTYQDNL